MEINDLSKLENGIYILLYRTGDIDIKELRKQIRRAEKSGRITIITVASIEPEAVNMFKLVPGIPQ